MGHLGQSEIKKVTRKYFYPSLYKTKLLSDNCNSLLPDARFKHLQTQKADKPGMASGRQMQKFGYMSHYNIHFNSKYFPFPFKDKILSDDCNN